MTLKEEIPEAVILPRMNSSRPSTRWNWLTHGRWALILAVIGGAIVAFEALTGARYAAWTLWIAVPFLMVSLTYFYAVNALPIFFGKRASKEPQPDLKKPPEK